MRNLTLKYFSAKNIFTRAFALFLLFQIKLTSDFRQEEKVLRNLTQPEFRHMPASWRFVLNFGFEFRISKTKGFEISSS
jgi:hypothetical protein